jgi:predicted transglutaminase-like cysteine proteinase
MSGLSYARWLRAVVVIAGLAGFCALPAVAAESSNQLGPDEPFGLFAAPVFGGPLLEKWAGLERELEDESLVLALCQEAPARCTSPAALRFLDIVDHAAARDGRARLGEINRAINLSLRPASDLALYGVIDAWIAPLAALTKGAGDCEDYAIAKYVALRAAGVARHDLRIVILHDTVRGEDHAVTAARLDGEWLLLDNRRMAMLTDGQLRNTRPLIVMDAGGVRQYIEPLAVAQASDPLRLASAPVPSPSSAP